MALDKFELNIIICKWVEKNFGMSEVENPSWDIDKLANYIAEQYGGPLEEEEAEMQFCMQEAIEYLAPCHVERDEDGSYDWYWSPEEGRK